MVSELAVDSLGMAFLGFTLATWLFGANTLQLYVYFNRYDDRIILKAVVVVVFLADMLNTIFTCWGIYLVLVDTPILPMRGNIPLVLESTASDVAIFVVQCFFARSIYQVCRHNKWLTGLILGLATLAFASGIALTGSSIASLSPSGKGFHTVDERLVALALGLVTLTDVVITVSLVGYLFHGKTSVRSTSSLLDRLILYCVQRGILTTFSHAIVLVLWYTLPTEWTWTLFQFSLGKVYTLTFLTLLNRRESLRSNSDPTLGQFDTDFQMSTQEVSAMRFDDGGDKATVSHIKSVKSSAAV